MTNIPLKELSEQLAKQGIYLNNGKMYDHHSIGLNATRIGFASKNEKEIEYMVGAIEKAVHYCNPK